MRCVYNLAREQRIHSKISFDFHFVLNERKARYINVLKKQKQKKSLRKIETNHFTLRLIAPITNASTCTICTVSAVLIKAYFILQILSFYIHLCSSLSRARERERESKINTCDFSLYTLLYAFSQFVSLPRAYLA